MGNSLWARGPSNEKTNIFHVKCVDENKCTLQEGTLTLAPSGLHYKSRRMPKKEMKWPWKDVSKFSYEGLIFSLVVGHRSPGGEGVYFFSCMNIQNLFLSVHNHTRMGQHLKGVGGGAPAATSCTPTLSGLQVSVPHVSSEDIERSHNKSIHQDSMDSIPHEYVNVPLGYNAKNPIYYNLRSFTIPLTYTELSFQEEMKCSHHNGSSCDEPMLREDVSCDILKMSVSSSGANGDDGQESMGKVFKKVVGAYSHSPSCYRNLDYSKIDYQTTQALVEVVEQHQKERNWDGRAGVEDRATKKEKTGRKRWHLIKRDA